MELAATPMPFTENRLWCTEKDRFLSQTWGCDAGHQLYPHESIGGRCAICGEKTFERGF